MYLSKKHRMYKTRLRVKLNVTYERWVVRLCQCRFIEYNKHITLVGDINNKESCVCVVAASIWEISAPSTWFYYKPKTTLKTKLCFKNIIGHLNKINANIFWIYDICINNVYDNNIIKAMREKNGNK